MGGFAVTLTDKVVRFFAGWEIICVTGSDDHMPMYFFRRTKADEYFQTLQAMGLTVQPIRRYRLRHRKISNRARIIILALVLAGAFIAGIVVGNLLIRLV